MANDSIDFSGRASLSGSFKRAWTAYKANFWMFSGMVVLYLVCFVVSFFLIGTFSPLLALILSFPALIIFPMAFYTAFRGADGGAEVEFSDFLAWTPRFIKVLGGMLILIVFFYFIMFIVGLVFGFSMYATAISAMEGSGGRESAEQLMRFGLGIFATAFIIGLLLHLITFAYQFLLVEKDFSIGQCLGMTVRIGLRYAGPIIVFFLAAFALSILSSLTYGLGFLIVIPLLLGTQYFFLLSMFPDPGGVKWDFDETPQRPSKYFDS